MLGFPGSCGLFTCSNILTGFYINFARIMSHRNGGVFVLSFPFFLAFVFACPAFQYHISLFQLSQLSVIWKYEVLTLLLVQTGCLDFRRQILANCPSRVRLESHLSRVVNWPSWSPFLARKKKKSTGWLHSENMHGHATCCVHGL